MNARSRAPSQSTQLGHISLAMSRSHCTISSSSDKFVLASLPRHQNLRKRGCAAAVIIFRTCADMEMETRQPAVVKTAGCCVSIEDGNYREWAGELVCRLEGLCRRASVLTG